MGKEAYELQGRNGVEVIGPLETFTGRSVSLQVAETATFEFDVVKPSGATATVSLTSSPVGHFPGGTVTRVAVTTGQVYVYPTSTDYTIA